MDDDGSGSIGVEEIKGPLIGLGLVDTVEEVEELINRVDEDKSGEIEFNEFLQIILNVQGNNLNSETGLKNNTITNFFKDLTSGKFKTSGLPFSNWILTK